MISDEKIDGYLDTLFGHSDPGDVMSHLLVASAGPADHNALGLPDPDKLAVTGYALAPDNTVDADQFVTRAIVAAIAEAREKEATIYFAALAMEGHTVAADGNEVTENLARRLGADHKLHEHPAAVEVTRLYAACRDGRRWTGEHILTGPKAGTIDGPQVRVGVLRRREMGPQQRLIRLAVGLV